MTKEKWPSGLHSVHNAKYLNNWSKAPHNKDFGATLNAFSSKLSGFCVCHPRHDHQIMHPTLRHAIHSAIANNTKIVTFLFLPCCGGRMSTNPCSKLISAYPFLCCTHGTISSSDLDMPTLHFGITKKKSCSPATTEICTYLLSGAPQHACVQKSAIFPGSGTWLVTILKLIGSTKISIKAQSSMSATQ